MSAKTLSLLLKFFLLVFNKLVNMRRTAACSERGRILGWARSQFNSGQYLLRQYEVDLRADLHIYAVSREMEIGEIIGVLRGAIRVNGERLSPPLSADDVKTLNDRADYMERRLGLLRRLHASGADEIPNGDGNPGKYPS